MEITAAVLRETAGPLTVEQLRLDPPAAGEILVEMRAAGVCHSDWHVVSGDSVVDLPVVPGHEGSGVIADVGPGVDGLRVGDHVALSWIPFCGTCRVCCRGHTNLCQTYQPALWAGTMLDGSRRLRDGEGLPIHHLSALSAWSTYSVVPAISCIPMPDVPFEISAVIGCAATTGVGAAIHRAEVRAGSSVAIWGAGGVGLSIVMGAVLCNAARIIVIDVQGTKEQLARSLGATDFVIAGDDTDAVAAIGELTRGLGVDYAFDAVGRTDIQAGLVASLGPLGTAVLVGLPRSGSSFAVDPEAIIRAEKTITGTIFGSAHTHRDFVRFAELYIDGRLPLDRLITDRYKLSEINEACQRMLAGVAGRGVVVF